jgi:hypothetical protein
MFRHLEKPMGAAGYSAVVSIAFACLCVFLAPSAAASPTAFSRTITDIEAPGVKAKVLGLDIEATRQIHDEKIYDGGVGPIGQSPVLLSTVDFNHSLSGKTDGTLSGKQMPKITVNRNPTTVTLSGKVATAKAEGKVEYWDIEQCVGEQVTTASTYLAVTLDGFYQSGTSSSSGNPGASLATENLDPWTQNCPLGRPQPSVTRIETFSTPTPGSLKYTGMGGPDDLNPVWTPGAGSLTTTEDGCKAASCDFTITGRNTNSPGPSLTGSASTKFTLRLRLEYPVNPLPIPAPNTKIVKGPKKVVKTKSGKAKVAFRFTSTGRKGTKFKCRLDKSRFAPCSSPFKRKVGPGKHRFAVVSVDRGKADPSPAVYRWTVQQTKKKLKR